MRERILAVYRTVNYYRPQIVAYTAMLYILAVVLFMYSEDRRGERQPFCYWAELYNCNPQE